MMQHWPASMNFFSSPYTTSVSEVRMQLETRSTLSGSYSVGWEGVRLFSEAN